MLNTEFQELLYSPVEEASAMALVHSDKVSELGEGDGEVCPREVGYVASGWERVRYNSLEPC